VKTLHVVSTLSPRAGGLSKAVLSVAAAQCRAGHPAGILHQGGSDATREALNTYRVFPGLETLRIFNTSPLHPRLAGALEEISPDAVHVHGLWEPLLHRALAWARANGVPSVVTPHGMSSPWQDDRYRLVKRFLRGMGGYERRWRAAVCIHALSDREAAHWHASGFERVRIVPNGLFPEEVESASPAAEWGGPPAGVPYVLFLGRLADQKAPDRLMQAFVEIASRFPDLHVVFAGPDYGLGTSLRRSAAGHGLRDRVWFPGQLDPDAKWTALRGALLLVHPSRNEGHSLVLLEAAAAGCPVLMSTGAGFPELAEAGGSMVYDESREGLAERLGELVDRETLRNTLGEQARAYVSNRYTWPMLLPDWMALYRP
jgi:glycosyltransferase involved in cell wall biosynthesis